MKFNLSKIPNSRENISLPEKATEELAEETGLHIGDGTMNFYKNRNSVKGSYALRGHIIDDKTHYNKRIKKLYKNLFDLNINLRDMPSTGVYGFQKWSDSLVYFKNKILELPLGKKLDVKIPDIFINNKKLTINLIRGVFDTDGMIYLEPKYGKFYPRIEIGTICPTLAKQIHNSLNNINIRTTCYLDKRKNENWHTIYKISIRGNEMLNKWMETIRPNNPNHWHKYYNYRENI